MNVIESDLLYTARSGSEFTDPVSGLVQPGQAAPETEESVAGEMIIIITILVTTTTTCEIWIYTQLQFTVQIILHRYVLKITTPQVLGIWCQVKV